LGNTSAKKAKRPGFERHKRKGKKVAGGSTGKKERQFLMHCRVMENMLLEEKRIGRWLKKAAWARKERYTLEKKI